MRAERVCGEGTFGNLLEPTTRREWNEKVYHG